jgi:hypothetical protein
MKRALPVLIVLLAALAFTNPDRQDFKAFVEERLNEAYRERGSAEKLGERIGQQTSRLAAGVVDSMTEHKNFVLFSLFEIPLVEKEYKYLGIGTLFIPLQSEQPLGLE